VGRLTRFTHKEAIEKAQASIEAALFKDIQDPHRLLYHASPPVHWMNDPNGLIFYNGEYHLFYQHNPYAPTWGNIHWAHMKSKDLIHWEHLPIALAPNEEYDIDGCFSGCAIEHESRLYLFYTANIFTSPQGLPDDLLQQQCMAVSADGTEFMKAGANPLISAPPADIGQTNHFRDPKVWKHNGIWYMVLGTKKDERGKVILYRSNDLAHWDFIGVLTESDGTMGYMHECPDLFALGGKHILAFSPQGMEGWGAPNVSGYYVGELDYERGAYEHGAFRLLDHGFNFYAPQTMTDDRGRRILFGWMPMEEGIGKTWAGCMTIPRELRYTEERGLQIQPVDEMKLLRRSPINVQSYCVSPGHLHKIQGMTGECVEIRIQVDLQQTGASGFGLQVRESEDGKERTLIRYDAAAKQIVFDRTHSGGGVTGIRTCEIAESVDRILTLHLFLDRSTLELFINEGSYVMSGYIFPEPTSKRISFFSENGSTFIRDIDFWELAV
jgi:beta-fructofuranosidase